MTGEIIGIIVLAALAEAFTEYFVVPLLEKIAAAEYAKYVALAVGIGLCVAYQIDLLQILVGLKPLHPVIGWVLSGTIIGRGANYLNDFIDYVRGLSTMRISRS